MGTFCGPPLKNLKIFRQDLSGRGAYDWGLELKASALGLSANLYAMRAYTVLGLLRRVDRHGEHWESLAMDIVTLRTVAMD